MDVTDIVDFNQSLLNPNDLKNSISLQKNDPTVGFAFDSTKIAGMGSRIFSNSATHA